MGTSLLVIEELTGKKRRLELRGAGLPLQGAGWGGTTQVATKWNPGNPEATQHVLGPQELPSEWNGEWHTTMLIASPATWAGDAGSSSEVIYASTLMQILDSVRRGGQLLRVTWTNEIVAATVRTFKLVRVGRLTEAKFEVIRQDDLKWSAHFEWIGRGETQQPVVDRGETLLAALRRANVVLNDAAIKIEVSNIRARNARRKYVSPFTLGQLEALADGPRQILDSFARAANSLANRMQLIGNLILKVRGTPAALAGQCVDVASNAVAVANQFVDRISREGPETISTRNKVSCLLRASSYYSGAQTEAMRVAAVNGQVVRGVARARVWTQTTPAGTQASQSDIMEVYLPHDGDTMVTISIAFYGEDLSGELSRANGLPLATITPPRIALIIPVRAVLERLQV